MSQKQQFFGVILARGSEKILSTLSYKIGQNIVDKFTKLNNINLPMEYFRADIL